MDMGSLTFEAAYAELETLIARLEADSLSLEASVELYERGRALAAHCQTMLDSAELRVSRLRDDGGLEPVE